MSNQERITCDYADCSKEYAYRIHGFNLCAEHLFTGNEEDEMKKIVRKQFEAARKEGK